MPGSGRGQNPSNIPVIHVMDKKFPLAGSRVVSFFLTFRRKKVLLGLVAVLLAAWACVLLVEWQGFDGSVGELPLFRDLYTQEIWPDIEYNQSDIALKLAPRTVHYLWCGRKQFRFQHYLAILSAIRLLQPISVVFHYTHLPVVDDGWYNVWFQELQQSYANLDLRKLVTFQPCGSKQMLETALSFISRHGGIFLGENAVLTSFPSDIMAEANSFWCAGAGIPGSASSYDAATVAFARHAFFDESDRLAHVDTILSGRCPGRCADVKEYDRVVGPLRRRRPPLSCVVVDSDVYPKDVWKGGNSSFARLARWLYYGKREALRAQPTADGRSIPRVGHMTWINHESVTRSGPFRFLHFLAVLSALHVAGLRHVYVHGDLEPRGRWWEELLKGENVTFLPLDFPRAVFQQSVTSLSHKSDIARAHILQKYGGVYQDRDVVWASRVPDWLLRYPSVACPDWPRNGEWPEVFNTGVFMSQPRAPWLRHFLSTMRHFLDHHHAFNAVMMSYRAYEWHPDTLYVDRYLQVICFEGICHPAWQDGYQRELYDRTRPRPFDWREGRAYHFTYPKIPASLTSPRAVASRNDVFAEIGRNVLHKAGRGGLLKTDLN